MKITLDSRHAIGYVVEVDGSKIILNLLDLHRGQVASHFMGISLVTEVGSLLIIDAGVATLVMQVTGLKFAEPKEAHRLGIGAGNQQQEPLRNISGHIVGRFIKDVDRLRFEKDSLSTPPLGARALPLTDNEQAIVLGSSSVEKTSITLGKSIRGGGNLKVGLTDFLSRHVAVLGSTGQGKSCFTAAMLQEMVKLPNAKIVIFDINEEYKTALASSDKAVKVTRLGGSDQNSYRIPYYALGRLGLYRLLNPSERTQRPALTFALENLNKVQWFNKQEGVGLVGDESPYMFADCRATSVSEASERLSQLRSGNSDLAIDWPHMSALAVLVSESNSIQPSNRGRPERSAFHYSNVAPLVTRIHRFIEDPMFTNIVDVTGGGGTKDELSWETESKRLVDKIFCNKDSDWKVHIIKLGQVPYDLMPIVLSSLLEVYAFELFNRGKENSQPTLLILEEAHHYLRPDGSEEIEGGSLAYERLAKEGRKFGLSLWLSTQRPSEISPTVLAQCNNWVVFRLTSEKDLSIVQSASEWSGRREVNQIAGLPRQVAMTFGGSISIPTIIRVPNASPLPKSVDGNFDSWAKSPK